MVNPIDATTRLNPAPLAQAGNTATNDPPGFSRALENTQKANQANPASDGEANKQRDTYKAFETMAISFFLKEAFKNDLGKAFGDGVGGDFYTQLFADEAAKQISEAGGLGIAKMLDAKSGANRN